MASRRSRPIGLVLSSVCAALGLWCADGLLAFTSAAPDATRVGLLPSPLALAGALAGTALLVVLIRRQPARVLPLFCGFLMIVPWLPIPLPPVLLLWTGPLAWIVWIAIGVSLLLASPVRRHVAAIVGNLRSAPWIAAAIAATLYGAASVALAPRLPAGDEPHYLVITQSLLKDHSLRIQGVIDRGDYHAYYPGPLRADYLRLGQDGQIYSVHAPGLPLIVAPAFALFGQRGVRVFLIVVSALASALIWRTAYLLVESAAAAWFGWAAVALSVPFFFQAFAIFPDGLGAILVFAAIACLVRLQRAHANPATAGVSTRALAACGLALAVLPWLHSRFAVLSVALAVCLLVEIRRGPNCLRRMTALLALPVVSAAAWLTFFSVIYGTMNPAAPYGDATQMAAANLIRGLPGLFFDQQFGLLPNAPVFAIALLGLWPLARRSRRLALELAVVLLPYLLAVAAYQMWWAGYSAPARFLVPIVLPCALPAAVWFGESRSRTARACAGATLFVSLILTGALAFAAHGSLVFNDRNGSALVLQWLSPILDLPAALPSLFRGTLGSALALTAVWIGCAALAIAGLRLAERRGWLTRTRTGPFLILAGVLVVTIATPAGWALNGAGSGIAPTAGQMDLLRGIAKADRPIAIQYSPLRRITPAALATRLHIGPPPFALPADPAPLIEVFDAPAGTYQIVVSTWNRDAGALWASVDSSLPPIARWRLDPRTVESVHVLHLPVAAPTISVFADARTRRGIARISLIPVRLVPPDDPLAHLPPRHGTRYGSATVFELSGQAYMEAGGIWMAGRARATFAMTPDADEPLRLRIRNAPVANTITIEADDWHRTLSLAPREARTIEVPRSPRPDATATIVTIGAATGFRPADLDPTVQDHRLLGCWLEVR